VSGFLVTPGDSEELSARLGDALTVDAEEFGAAGRQRCESQFSWNVVAPKYLSLYQELGATRTLHLAGSGARRP